MDSTPLYKYLHIDSADRNEHETSARMDIHLAANPITNIRRVGVLKSTITNTGHNVFFNHDSIEIGVKINGNDDPTPHAVLFKLPHTYYSIAQLVVEINAQIDAYTNVSNPELEEAVQNIIFSLQTDASGVERVKMNATAMSVVGIDAYYALIVRKQNTPNSILPELGFHSDQTISERTWSIIAGKINNNTLVNVKDSPKSSKKAIKGSAGIGTGVNSINYFLANHTFRIENPSGFFFASKALTAGGNVMKTSLNFNGVGIVQHDDHLVYIPNKANRDEYNHYETNVVEWHEVNGDIQNFDLELRSHGDKLIKVEDSSVEDAGSGSAIPPFTLTLIFECSRTSFIHPNESRAVQEESYYLAHRQN